MAYVGPTLSLFSVFKMGSCWFNVGITLGQRWFNYRLSPLDQCWFSLHLHMTLLGQRWLNVGMLSWYYPPVAEDVTPCDIIVLTPFALLLLRPIIYFRVKDTKFSSLHQGDISFISWSLKKTETENTSVPFIALAWYKDLFFNLNIWTLNFNFYMHIYIYIYILKFHKCTFSYHADDRRNIVTPRPFKIV